MQIETHDEEFEEHSWLGNFLRKLHIDIPLFIGLLLISLLSFAILYSASTQNLDVLFKHFMRSSLALVFMIALAHVHPYQFKRYSLILYGFGVFLLFAVLVLGEFGKGAQRWLDLGLFRFQPSEMLKISTPMMIAWYLSAHILPPRGKQLGIAALLIIVPTLLIAKQPDLGTALLVASSGAAVLFFAGLSWWFIVSMLLFLASITPILF